MKKKLDLNNLIAKYDGASRLDENTQHQPSLQREFYQHYPQEQPNRDGQPFSKMSRTDNHLGKQEVSAHYQRNSEYFVKDFVQSKEQCEKFLLQLQQYVRNEEKKMKFSAEDTIKMLLDNFYRIHQKVKKQILELLAYSFAENQRRIRQELSKSSVLDSPEFQVIHSRIVGIEDEVAQLLTKLRSTFDFMQAAIIAEQLRKWSLEMEDLKVNIKQAKQNYLIGLGLIDIDRTKIEEIKDSLSKLFYLRRMQRVGGYELVGCHLVRHLLVKDPLATLSYLKWAK